MPFIIVLTLALLASSLAAPPQIRMWVLLEYSASASDPALFPCLGSESYALTNRFVVLENSFAEPIGEWIHTSDLTGAVTMRELSIPANAKGIQIRLLHLDHGGGTCNCWGVDYIGSFITQTDLTDVFPPD